MLRHVREAIRQAGLDVSDVEEIGGAKHRGLRAFGHKIRYASTPKNEQITIMNMVRDLKRAKGNPK